MAVVLLLEDWEVNDTDFIPVHDTQNRILVSLSRVLGVAVVVGVGSCHLRRAKKNPQNKIA